jgi:hypothetical protein
VLYRIDDFKNVDTGDFDTPLIVYQGPEYGWDMYSDGHSYSFSIYDHKKPDNGIKAEAGTGGIGFNSRFAPQKLAGVTYDGGYVRSCC